MLSRLPKALFGFAVLMAVFAYGMVAGKYQVFPYAMISLAREAIDDALHVEHLHRARREGNGVTVNEPGRVQPGLTFMTGFFDGKAAMQLVALDGTVIHRWIPSFKEAWPDPEHIVPAKNIPKTDGNTAIHGAVPLPDGSVVFNFEYHGLVKLDKCGRIVWKVPHMTHHSVFFSEDGTFWVSVKLHHDSAGPEFKNFKAPFLEELALQVSPDGEIMREISLPKLLLDADMEGLLFPTGRTPSTNPGNDLTHLNDVEVLQAADADAFPMFEAGDIMASLRNINLVVVFDPDTGEVKWHQTGPWLRQHDPDFVASGKIAIFNNRLDNTETGSIFGGSNIVEVDPATRKTRIVYSGSKLDPFFSDAMGKHQYLANGNILITESFGGRILEIDADGAIVWEFVNRHDQEWVSLVTEGSRYAENYFRVQDWSCDR